MKTWIKGGLMGLGIWIVLTLVFLFSGVNYECVSPDISGPCYSSFQEILKEVNDYIAFPLLFTSSSPVYNYWGFVFAFIWGSLIGLIYSKFKN